MKNQSLLIATTLLVVFLACKKEEEDKKDDTNTGGKTKTEHIRAKNWKITSLVSNSADIWNTPLVEACNRDNQYKFRADDSLVLFDMTNKCDISDPDSTISSYKLYDNDTKLILKVSLTSSLTIDDTVDIVTLDENTLKINAEYSGLPATITFTHP